MLLHNCLAINKQMTNKKKWKKQSKIREIWQISNQQKLMNENILTFSTCVVSLYSINNT